MPRVAWLLARKRGWRCAQSLRRLEEDGVINRRVYPEVPPRVEYRITDFGKTLISILEALYDWGQITWGLRTVLFS